MTAHLRMNAIYWGLTALCIMGHKDALDREEMIEYVMSCWDETAGLFIAWCSLEWPSPNMIMYQAPLELIPGTTPTSYQP